MSLQEFTFILSGVSEITPELADALYEAMNGDIEFNMRDSIAYLECRREADTLREAILAMITEVEGADVGVRVIRVESEAANTIAKVNVDLLQVVNG
jgi:hypothetical protein